MVTVNKILWAASLLGTTLLAVMLASAKKRNVIYHQLAIGSLKTHDASLKVFFISDIHRRKIDDKLLRKIDRDIDIVIIGGDLAERGVPLQRISKNIRNLARLGPIFYIWGNNDREAGEQEIRAIITQYGGKILDNENCSVPGHPTWGICGTDDTSSRNVDIDATLQGVHLYNNVIFVSHQPEVLEKVEKVFQPEMMLAGHTHGGQIRVGKFGLFERGSFQTIDGCGKLISNGYGTSTVPLRLGASPECHVITLHYNESEVKER